MATEKQVAANRANAKYSTGPKTMAGKSRSAQNAYRHGLSAARKDHVDIDASLLAIRGKIGKLLGDEEIVDLFAQSIYELRRIREVRHDFIRLGLDIGQSGALRRLAALDRYERIAQTRVRRVERRVEKIWTEKLVKSQKI